LGRRPLGAILHSSNEPGELSQWFCHDDSTINIALVIIIIIIIYYTGIMPLNFATNQSKNPDSQAKSLEGMVTTSSECQSTGTRMSCCLLLRPTYLLTYFKRKAVQADR